MLLLMADIYSEADHPCSALPYALSAWLHATELGMDLKVPHLLTSLPSRVSLPLEGHAVQECSSRHNIQQWPEVFYVQAWLSQASY